ncbi:hypothetical protein Hanom_Chr13g01198231 [Helianthus anomalus]
MQNAIPKKRRKAGEASRNKGQERDLNVKQILQKLSNVLKILREMKLIHATKRHS